MGASMSLDVGVLDHCAPNLGLFPDECRGLGRSAPGGVQVDLGKVHAAGGTPAERSEEHTSELQSLTNLVCRLLLEKKKYSHIAVLAEGRVRNSSTAEARTPARELNLAPQTVRRADSSAFVPQRPLLHLPAKLSKLAT